MRRHSAVLLLLAALLPEAASAAPAGTVMFAFGRVTVVRDGAELPLARGDALLTTDVVKTGPVGIAQLRMVDGAVFSLRAGSELNIQTYEAPPLGAPLPGHDPDHRPVAPNGGGRAVLTLVKGGFRTITGLIGKYANSEYRVSTPMATIGVRGCDYTVIVCNGNCGKTQDGVHLGVSEGNVSLENGAGKLELHDDDYGYVGTGSEPPEERLERPEIFQQDTSGQKEQDAQGTGEAPAQGEQSTGSDGTSTGTDSGTGTDAGGTGTGSTDSGTGGTSDTSGTQTSDTGDGWTSATDLGSAPLANPDTGNYTPPPPPSYIPPQQPAPTYVHPVAFSLGSLAGAQFNADGTPGGTDLTSFLGGSQRFAIGTAQNVNTGYDPVTQLRWGRWSPAAGVTVDGSAIGNGSTDSLHWIAGPDLGGAPAITRSGTATFTLIGNTDPTDSAGNVGFLGSATLGVDFTAGTVDSTLALSVGGVNWNATGSGSLTSANTLFSGSYNGGISIDGVLAPSATGVFAGFIIPGTTSSDLPTGAGLTYTLDNGISGPGHQDAAGAAAFKGP
ncbi:MAG TPA: FecR family protein [Candidatus Binatia bacterium]|nr:FecR family protein [Candidatus Binatia bacterium]